MTGVEIYLLVYLICGLLTAIGVVWWLYRDSDTSGDSVLYAGLAALCVWPIVVLGIVVGLVARAVLLHRDRKAN